MRYITPSVLFAVATLVCVLLFLRRYVRAAQTIPADPFGVRPRLTFAGKRRPMERKDRLPVLLITLVYAATAFFQLGDLTAPQTFVDFKDRGAVTIQLHGTAGSSGTTVRAGGLRCYTGLGTGGYNVEVSADGERWYTLWARREDPEDSEKVTGWYWADAKGFLPSYALTQKYNQLFKWIDVTVENPVDIQFLRITGREDASQEVLELGKLALLDQNGEVIPILYGMTDTSESHLDVLELFNWEDVPEKSTWHNSTYFDEIYHARTAKEHIDGVYPYEVTHPPLGKLILGLGIRLFGMTPFGWRFSGTLFGVLMLPILYIFLKNMFGKTPVAACGTILFAAEFMHLTQTRIATIDTYAVFFILAMYFFLYRYLTLPQGTSFGRSALPLFLSGLMWGIGVSCKWTVIYGGIGLAVVYFMGFCQRLRDWPEDRPGRAGWVVSTLLFSVLCFILIPLVIYTASYLPYAQAKGLDLSLANTLNGARESLPALGRNLWGHFTGGESFSAETIPQDSLTGVMANNQWYMLTYHQGVDQAHPYASRWYHWLVDGRPILYYMDNDVPGFTTRFAAFANPVTCWAGLGAVVLCAVEAFCRREARAAFLLVGYFSQLAPWWLIHRTTFAYHYFPSLLFLVFALSYLFDCLVRHDPGWRRPVYGLTGLSVGLYALFYPVLIGLTIPTWYEPLVKWIESWPF